MKVLVTGGCGFFGAWIIKQLLEEGHTVVVVDVVVRGLELYTDPIAERQIRAASCAPVQLFTKRWDYIMQDAASKVTFTAGARSS